MSELSEKLVQSELHDLKNPITTRDHYTVSYGTITAIGGVITGVYYSSGLFVAPLINKLGCRYVIAFILWYSRFLLNVPHLSQSATDVKVKGHRARYVIGFILSRYVIGFILPRYVIGFILSLH